MARSGGANKSSGDREGQDVFDREHAVGGPVNSKTGVAYGPRTKTYQDWAAGQTRQVLTDEQAALVGRWGRAPLAS